MNLVDVIIPTYKPDNKFLVSIKRLLAQTVAPGKIIIINTDKTVWDKTGIEEKLKELFEKYKIEQKNISIERVNINPRSRYRDNGDEYFDGYEVVQNIAVLITKIEDYEVFLTELLNTGVDRIYNVGFSVADMRKLMDEARVEAVKAAEEKALLLCKAATNSGKPLSLGKIISISEKPTAMYNYDNYVAQNMKQAAYDEAAGGNFSPMGQIEVSAEISVVFELE